MGKRERERQGWERKIERGTIVGEREREIQGRKKEGDTGERERERYRGERQSERETGEKERERERGERKILLLQTQKNSWNFILSCFNTVTKFLPP